MRRTAHCLVPSVYLLLVALFLGGCGGGDSITDVGQSGAGAGGSAGHSGHSGTAGSAGSAGSAGASGASGASGTSGTSGTSGASGVGGAAGASGASGTSGTAGNAGAAGSASATTVVSISPEDAALHVAPLTPVVIQLSGPIDLATLTADSVAVFSPKASLPRPTNVVYEPTHHWLTLTPSTPYFAGDTFRVVVDGLNDPFGNAISVNSTFTAAYQSSISVTYYTADGMGLDGGYWFERDFDGRVTRRVGMNDVGPDGLVGTNDDVPIWYVDTSYDGTASITRQMGDAGPDGVWFNDDDTSIGRSWADEPWVGENHGISYSAGPDATLNTPDDVPQNFSTTSFTEAGLVDTQKTFSGTGLDGVAFTDDDVLQYFSRTTYEIAPQWPDGLLGTHRLFINSGPDGQWSTSDDTVGQVDLTLYNARLLPVGQITLEKGADGVWDTADDVAVGAYKNLYDGRGVLVASLSIVAPGPDGLWLTDDDVKGQDRTAYHHTDDGRLFKRESYLAGQDGILDTSDDVLVGDYAYEPSL